MGGPGSGRKPGSGSGKKYGSGTLATKGKSPFSKLIKPVSLQHRAQKVGKVTKAYGKFRFNTKNMSIKFRR